MEQLIRLYEQWAGGKPATIEKVKGAGSNRIYYRLTDDAHHSVIGVVGTSREENHAFISLAKHFGQRQLPVPEILAASSSTPYRADGRRADATTSRRWTC